jgi:hydrogenase nickel incorporation protein HypA/HybF
MHETSLVEALLEQVQRICADDGASSVEEVHVQLGPLSGVEPLLVTTAFEWLKQGTSAAAAQLVIENVPLEAVCSHCGLESEIHDFRFFCGHCGHDDVQVVRGDEFQLVSVTVDSTDGCAQNPEAATR